MISSVVVTYNNNTESFLCIPPLNLFEKFVKQIFPMKQKEKNYMKKILRQVFISNLIHFLA